MRALVAVASILLALLAAAPAEAHWVKSEGCGGTPWVDQDPTDNDLLGPDPSAVLVVHAACPDVDCEADLFPVFACQPHP